MSEHPAPRIDVVAKSILDFIAALARRSENKAAVCIACRQPIVLGASICGTCKSFQKSWKNTLQYASGVAALIVITASASVWIWGEAKNTILYRDDVRVISANSLSSAVVANFGDGEVFVSHLIFFMVGRQSNWQAPGVVFEDRIPPGQFLRHEFDKPRIAENSEILKGLTASEFEDAVTKAANSDPCFELAFFSANDPKLRELEAMAGPTLNTFPVNGYLEYWGRSHKSSAFQPVDGAGIVLKSRQSVCRA